ncbi:MAG: ATP-binding protein [Victivallales bacterium]|nr:ATP-binding protein [Victivallales bacterium]
MSRSAIEIFDFDDENKEKRMTRSSTRKTSSKKSEYEQLEYDRLFGSNIDHYMAMNRCQVLARIFHNAGPQDVNDDDIWDTTAPFIKVAEFQSLLDELIPSKAKQSEFIDEHTGSYHRRNNVRNTSNILEALYSDIANRKYIWEMLAEIMDTRVKEYNAIINAKEFQPRALQKRIEELKKYLGLDDHERDMLLFFFMQESDRLKLGDFAVSTYRNTFDTRKLAVVMGLEEFQVGNYLADNANLHKYGIIDDDGDVDRCFISFLTGTSSQALSERFWTKSTEEALPWEFHGKIAEEHGKVIAEMVKSKPAGRGISILLYGAAGAGKTSFSQSLAALLGRDLYFIAQNDKDSSRRSYSASFRYAALSAAQRQLDPDKCILVMDECDDMIEANRANGFFGLFMTRDNGAETKGQLNTVIDENRHTVIWICNSQQDAIAKSSRRRFDYSVLFDELLPETRVHIWENCLKRENCDGKLSEEFIGDVSRKYKVNAGGIALAVKNAASLVAADPSKSFEECVSTFLQAHCALLGIRKSNDERLEPARDYSLEGLNIKSGIRPERIIQVCRNYLDAQKNPGQAGRDRPRMNLLLHGVPGSGKTEFVKYLAKQLGKKLNIKNASDLLSMYVGGTEHLLAAAFAEAEKNNEMLFIDEGDSMLSSRDGAQRSWEVSQVNTLLTEMENFNGIFAVSTNLIQKLDPAALRRFTFRIHFDFLDDKGKEIFYKTYFAPLNAPELTNSDLSALHAIERLTPSDFRNVRQQLFYLEDSELTSKEIIDALRQEAQSRDSFDAFKGLGEEKHGIGFSA